MKQRILVFAFGALLAGGAILPAHAQLFGESDADKDARLQHESDQDAQISQLGNRLQQDEDKARSLTESLSRATGTNEELRHQLELLNQKMDRQQKDFAYRLCMLSAQQLGADPDSGLNCAAAGTASAGQANAGGAGVPGGMTPGAALPPLGSQGLSRNMGQSNMGQNNMGQDNSDGAPLQLGRPPGVLGTLSAGANPPPARSGAGATQFDSAMNLLAKAQYNEAKAGFRGYADANPDDADLSAQAIYWVGDINYVQRDYPNAARAFAEQIKKYPGSSRSPDSMLKLGQSLLAMGQTNEGCTTLGALKSKFPKAPPATLAAAKGARSAACH